MQKNIRLSEIDTKSGRAVPSDVRCVERRRYRHAYHTVKNRCRHLRKRGKDKGKTAGKRDGVLAVGRAVAEYQKHLHNMFAKFFFLIINPA